MDAHALGKAHKLTHTHTHTDTHTHTRAYTQISDKQGWTEPFFGFLYTYIYAV